MSDTLFFIRGKERTRGRQPSVKDGERRFSQHPHCPPTFRSYSGLKTCGGGATGAAADGETPAPSLLRETENALCCSAGQTLFSRATLSVALRGKSLFPRATLSVVLCMMISKYLPEYFPSETRLRIRYFKSPLDARVCMALLIVWALQTPTPAPILSRFVTIRDLPVLTTISRSQRYTAHAVGHLAVSCASGKRFIPNPRPM